MAAKTLDQLTIFPYVLFRIALIRRRSFPCLSSFKVEFGDWIVGIIRLQLISSVWQLSLMV